MSAGFDSNGQYRRLFRSVERNDQIVGGQEFCQGALFKKLALCLSGGKVLQLAANFTAHHTGAAKSELVCFFNGFAGGIERLMGAAQRKVQIAGHFDKFVLGRDDLGLRNHLFEFFEAGIGIGYGAVTGFFEALISFFSNAAAGAQVIDFALQGAQLQGQAGCL